MSDKKTRAKSSGGQKSSGSPKGGARSTVAWLVLLTLSAGLASYVVLKPAPLPSLTGPAHSVKLAYPTFDSFVSFYLSEHSNGISRLLHVVGTSLVILMVVLRDLRFALTLVAALSVGLLVRELTIGLAHGFVEFVAMLVSFVLLNKLFIGRLGLELLIVPYTFAWVGHFFFEHNTPATFLYPSYSLMGDFYMFFGVLTTKIPITF